MPDPESDSAPGVPAPAPGVGDRVPPTHPPLEIPAYFLERVKLYTYVKREEIWKLTQTDSNTQKHLRQLKALEEERLPTEQEIHEAEKQAKAWVAKVAIMKNRKHHRRAEMETIKARIKQRLNTLAEIRLRSIVGNIRRVVGITPSG